MRRLRLWLLVMNGLSVWLMLTTAEQHRSEYHHSRYRSHGMWHHVNKTCLVPNAVCNADVSAKHIQKLQQNMNTRANPCEDFHTYACGNWQGHHRSQPTMTSVMQMADGEITDKFVQMFDELRTELRDKRFASECRMLCAPDHRRVYDQLIKYYNVCSEQSEPVTLRGYFNVLAGEAVWHARPYNWLAGVAHVTSYGQSDLFLQLEVKQDNATYHIVRVQPLVQVGVQLTSETYDRIGGYARQNYNTLSRKFRRLESELRDIMALACAGQPLDAEGECDLREEFTLDGLQRAIPEINWWQFLEPQLGAIIKAPHLRVRIEDVQSIRKIAKYLNGQDPELLLAYTLARFANYLQQMPHNLMQAGVSQRTCMRHMRKLFHQPMTFLYEQIYYASDRAQSEPLIHSVFDQLKHEFRRTLHRNRLQLSAAALTYVERKLDTLRLNVGNTPVNASAQFYIDYMTGMNASGNFYNNHLQALRHSYVRQRALAAMQPGVDDDSPWHTFSYHAPHFLDNIDSTAYYFCLNNMIILPHAYMQLPLFHQHLWPAFVYGDLANTLGHELMHAFDANFLMFDHRGQFHEELAALFDTARHNESIRCFSADATVHLTERMADISGTRLAIDTFMRDAQFLHRNGRAFFLQFAQFFCGAADEATHNANDPTHDVDRVRLNYAMAQTPEFASTFNCPLGSALNPTQRCEYW